MRRLHGTMGRGDLIRRYHGAPLLTLLGTLLALGVAACVDDTPPVLRETVEHSLDDDRARTLAVDAVGRVWVGAPGRMRVVGDSGSVASHATPGEESARLIGGTGDEVYLLSGDTLGLYPAPDSGGVADGMRRAVPAPDPHGRFLLRGEPSGAVTVLAARTLDPIIGWGAMGAATTALIVSPEGDRAYQALAPGDGGPRLLVRDLQTGRILWDERLEAPITSLATGADGTLYAADRDGERVRVAALRVRADGVTRQWTRSVDSAGDGADVALDIAGGRVVLRGEAVHWGLVVLNARSGDVIARARAAPLDAAVGADGTIRALYPGEVRRLD